MSTTGTQVEIYPEAPAWKRPREAARAAVTAPAAEAHILPAPTRLAQSPPAPWMTLQLAGIALAPLALLSYVFWDRPVFHWARDLTAMPGAINWAAILSWAAHGTVVAISLLALLAVALRAGGPRLWRWTFLALVSFIASGLSCSLLKFLFGRYRPRVLSDGHYGFDPLSLGYDFNSFPSGHAVAIGALMGIALLARPRLAPLWVALALVWSSARVFTLSHYASDVMVGLFYGCAWSFLIYTLTLRRRWWNRQFDPAR